MAVANKTAAFTILLRSSMSRSCPPRRTRDVALAALAVATIAIGNIGAIGQDYEPACSSYSGMAQAGYMLASVRAREKGLAVRRRHLLPVRVPDHEHGAFAWLAAREARERARGPHRFGGGRIGATRPALAAADDRRTRARGTARPAGFPGKFFLIEATVTATSRGSGSRSSSGRCCRSRYSLRVHRGHVDGELGPAPNAGVGRKTPEADPETLPLPAPPWCPSRSRSSQRDDDHVRRPARTAARSGHGAAARWI